MKKLLAMYKSLPREARMMLAMAGLATPFGAIYMLRRVLFPGWPMWKVILAIFVIVLVLSALGWFVSRLFSRGKRKRNKKMADDLAGDAESGRVSMDVRASIKANNDKFFGAIKDMRKNLGISVYDLPWYIVMGDSGCGKTRLINEGGLTFSTGKPEGYQLGTLNYNWWFSEDAIFVDMAGRLCNPQEDADRREWEAFLGTVGKGRKGTPINGAIVCVSADHLLQDSAEKVEQDANTALERLRDLQGKLGVTFATYLVITKCDKILGFMQLFDRAERDITIKNQIFGWSRPGEVTELYDPELFGRDFNDLYLRLNELRLRRLNDEVDEIDMGLAYSFPEEFREFREPLQTYVRTLFPMIKNPRAIKNLIFRGIYFTSATQEGTLILKHLAERLGEEAAGQFAPLDLYPNKRPYFIKDLLFRKIFPEHGLVFRNEQQAVRNRKLGRMLWAGSIALGVVLFTLVGISSLKFGKVINKPRLDAQAAKPADPYTPSDALVKAGEFGGHVRTLQENKFWATVLSLGYGTDEPIDDLQLIQAVLFEREVLRVALQDISQVLRETNLPDPDGTEATEQQAEAFVVALEEYLTWFGCAGEEQPPEQISLDGFLAMCRLVTDAGSPLVAARESLELQAKAYFKVIADDDEGDWRNPAAWMVLDEQIDAAGTVAAALEKLHGYLERYAGMDPTGAGDVLKEWLRIRDLCARLQHDYDGVLALADERVDADKRMDEFQERFATANKTYAEGLEQLKWTGPWVDHRIPTFRDAVLNLRERWTAWQERLSTAYLKCETPPDQSVTEGLAQLAVSLDEVLFKSLQEAKLIGARETFTPGFFDDPELGQRFVNILERYDHMVRPVEGQRSIEDAKVEPTPPVRVVAALLARVDGDLSRLSPTASEATLQDWLKELDRLSTDTEQKDRDWPIDKLSGEEWKDWHAATLDEVQDIYLDLMSSGRLGMFLRGMHARLDGLGEWGIAELYSCDEWAAARSSTYSIALPQCAAGGKAAAEPTAAEEPADDDQGEADDGWGRRRRSPSGSDRRADDSDEADDFGRHRQDQVAVTPGRGKRGRIPGAAHRDFLREQGLASGLLRYQLGKKLDGVQYSSGDRAREPLHRSCQKLLEEKTKAYFATYARAWGEAYRNQQLDVLNALGGAGSWQALATQLDGKPADEGAAELRSALEEVLGALPCCFWQFDETYNEWWDNYTDAGRQRQELVDWMRDAISRNASGLGSWATEVDLQEYARASSASSPPWRMLAADLAQEWQNLAARIVKNKTLPTEFNERTSGPVAMTWGKLAELRSRAGLGDEALTQKLVVFEDRAKSLLDRELTEIIRGIQRRRSSTAGGGSLPFRSSGGAATVDFREFTEMLKEVAEAQKVFAALDKNLASSANRSRFYASCGEWYSFILKPSGEVRPLHIKVQPANEDQVRQAYASKPCDDFAQQFYKRVELDLGLDAGPLVVPTSFRDLRNEDTSLVLSGYWRWSVPLKDLGFRFLGGYSDVKPRPPDLERKLMPPSQLALCAYLRDGRPMGNERRQWMQVHSFNLKDKFRNEPDLLRRVEENPTQGLAFVFELDRAMPAPIDPL